MKPQDFSARKALASAIGQFFFNREIKLFFSVSLAPQTSGPSSRLSRMPHGRHIKEKRKEIRIGNFSLDGSSHQTGDAAFTPAMPHDLHHSRANNDAQLTQHATHESKTKYTCFTQKDTQPSQACSGGQITPNPTQNRRG
jgi:hypothetical protein